MIPRWCSSDPVRPGRGPEDRLRDLQRRFRTVSARHDRAIKLRGYYRHLGIAALASIVVAFAVVWGLSTSPWPVMTTLRHIASSPNCAFARQVGLGLRLESEKTDGERVYRIVAGKNSADAAGVPSA
jgi:hypothetical protein